MWGKKKKKKTVEKCIFMSDFRDQPSEIQLFKTCPECTWSYLITSHKNRVKKKPKQWRLKGKCFKWSLLNGYSGDLAYYANVSPNFSWHLLAEGLHCAGIRPHLLLPETPPMCGPSRAWQWRRVMPPRSKASEQAGCSVMNHVPPALEKRVK